MDWTASDERGVAERVAHQRHQCGHDHRDAVDHRPGRRDLHGRRDCHRGRGDRLAEDDHGDADRRPADAAGAGRVADDASPSRPQWAARAQPPRRVSVTNTGSGTLDVTASDDAAWLAVTPASATAPATLTVTPTITGLAAGTYTAHRDRHGDDGRGDRLAQDDPRDADGQSGRSANLVGAWGFDETTGTTAADASGQNNTGTITGATHTRRGQVRRRAELQRHEQLGHRGRREQPRPHRRA